MNQEDDFRSLNVAIIGLGLMGGSLAMALQGRCRQVWAVDRDPVTVEDALSTNLVQRASVEAEEILPGADLVILAVPVLSIIDYLGKLDAFHPGPAVVIDLGSTKARILQGMAALPERFDPIGGHPMCGKESSGLGVAEAGLFRDAPFALCPLPRTSERARAMAFSLAHLIGARPMWLDAAEHDAMTAVTSHIPYLIADALAGSADTRVAPLIGPGFRSTTRLAGSSLPMMVDILSTNQENILSALHAFRARLDEIECALEDQEWPTLQALLIEGAQQRRVLIGGER